MPVVEIKWFKGRSREVKAKVAARIEQAMIEEAGCKSGDTHVVFQDVERADWAISGNLMDKQSAH